MTMANNLSPEISALGRDDRRALVLLFCTFALCYGYFYQGGGGNSNSHLDTIRALVERGATEITPYWRNTADIGFIGGRVYANKPPGLAFVAAPVYFAAYRLERALGLDPASAAILNFNGNLLTFWTSGLPGAFLVLLLYRHFRREGGSVSEGVWLAAAFGLGSLAFPYAGIMMSHSLSACLLFAAWSLLDTPCPSRSKCMWAGFLSGMAIMTDSLALPAVALFLVYVLAVPATDTFRFLSGAGVVILALLTHNYLCFGNPLTSNTAITLDVFKTKGYLLGFLGWPQPVRLFWLTLHPFRGIFACCPVLLVSLLSIRPSRLVWPLALKTIVPLGIVAFYFLFNMSFNGWTGGYAVGPRYIIPALPFLFSFALVGFRRFRMLSVGMTALSAFMMFAVSAVTVLIPAENQGPPPPISPVSACIRLLVAGRVSVSTSELPGLEATPADEWTSCNLGQLFGLHGLASLVPIVLVLVLFVCFARRLSDSRAVAGRSLAASV
jgi:hypothetical protein